jgi:hypothetical protein
MRENYGALLYFTQKCSMVDMQANMLELDNRERHDITAKIPIQGEETREEEGIVTIKKVSWI